MADKRIQKEYQSLTQTTNNDGIKVWLVDNDF
jgi:ubiquitin-protein ligase